MAYALIKDGAVARYPYGPRDYRKDHPNTGIPRGADDAFWAALGVVKLQETAKPDTPVGHVAVQAAAPVVLDGTPVLE